MAPRSAAVAARVRKEERDALVRPHTYTDFAIAQHVSPAAFKLYLEAKGTILETAMVKDNEQRVKEAVAEEVARLEAMSEAERQLRTRKNHVVERILTLACPRCGQAFLDFNGCIALTC